MSGALRGSSDGALNLLHAHDPSLLYKDINISTIMQSILFLTSGVESFTNASCHLANKVSLSANTPQPARYILIQV